ncbi:MAG TPA: hypothetical protein VGS19_29125 [Streptosporangiaceae bacterium]|nr:hypothetical protein [Streptosporangiaceae bacterium]
MAEVLAGAVLVVVLVGYWVARAHRRLSQVWFLGVAWRFLSGHRDDGRPGRLRRAGWRCGAAVMSVALAAGWVTDPQVTAIVLGFVAVCGLVLSAVLSWRWARQWKHRRVWLRPLHLAAHELAQVDRRRAPHAWLQVEPDRSAARLALPAGWSADDRDKKLLVQTATEKLGIEAPEVSWRLAGPRPLLMLAASQPPPARVTLADVLAAVDRAREDEPVWGLGKKSAVVASSLSGDSPHLGLSMGSGAGKSVTARALAAQMLYKGCVVLVLDYKMISHQWAQGLPNVVIARRPHEIHEALIWLGGEVDRRNEVALAGADLDGNVHAVVGSRIIVICEELNATMSKLRAYWRGLRNEDRSLPQRSPALEALDAVNLMGRQVLVNLVYMGQRLSVKAVGGDGDARESIGVIAFGRYTPSNWKMLAGDHPMPPPSRTPGRIQVVSDCVREVQCVFMTAREARELAVAGAVAALPHDMPGAGAVLAATAARIGSPDLLVSQGHATPGPRLVTLSEAVGEGIVSCKLPALRKASQRDGFPERVGLRSLAGEYRAADLAEWDAVRRE